MGLSEICYRILLDGLGSLKSFRDFPVIERFLRAVLGKRYKYVWGLKGCTDISREGGSVSRVNRGDLNRRKKTQTIADAPTTSRGRGKNGEKDMLDVLQERAAELACEHLLQNCLDPKKRASTIRRAERRVAKEEVAYARKWISKEPLVTQGSVHEKTVQGKRRKIFETALRAADKALQYEELRAAEKKAFDASRKVFLEIISAAYTPDDALIDEAVKSALEAGLDSVTDEDDMRDAVTANLEQTLNRIAEKLRRSSGKNLAVLGTAEEVQRHARCGEETEDTLKAVMTAARKGATRASREDIINPQVAIPGVVEKRLGELGDRIAAAIRDPKRVGKHCLHFLRYETSSVIKRVLYAKVTAPVEDVGALIDRQVIKRLHDLEDKQNLIISRRRKGFKDLFWGLKEWKMDEDRWQRSCGNVDIDELAAELPHFSGKPKTTGAIDYKCCDLLSMEALRLHGSWLMTRHFREIVRLKTGHMPKGSGNELRNDDRGQNQSVEDLPHAASESFITDLERVDFIDKLLMDQELRAYWNVVRQNWNRYDVAMEALKEAGWTDYRIRKNKNKFLELIGESKGSAEFQVERDCK